MSVNSRYIIQNIIGEIPTGSIDGINKNFELDSIPLDNTLEVILNGLVQREGASFDYTVTSNIITFIKAPKIDSIILTNYKT